MRTVVWVGLGILALNVLLIGMLALIALISRFKIARTRRELERLGLLVRLPYAPESRPMWPRLLAGFAGLAALAITTSAITATPSRTMASTAGSPLDGAPTRISVEPGATPGSLHHASQDPTASLEAASRRASVTSPTSSAADPESDAGAPSAVAAVATSPTAIHLEWEPVSDAVRYDIERSNDSVDWNAVASTGGEQTAYTDDALSSGTTYYYRVAAFVEGEDVSRSDAVSATTAVDTSTPPVLVSATGSASSIALEWIDVDGEVGYRIERSADGTSGWTQIGTTGQGVTSYTDTGLAPATSYHYRVVAVTADGDSPPSTALTAATTDTEPSTSGATSTASEAPKDPKDPNP